ncbi:MAG: DUF6048 family protein [Marinilabiliaceae bacterium]
MRTFRFSFISILAAAALFCPLGSLAQSQSDGSASSQTTTQADDDEPKREPRFEVVKDQGLSLGIDLSPFIMRLIKDERTGFAFVGRYGIKNRWFANAELGYEHIKYDKEGYAYKSDGTFVRLGVDYDIFNSEDFPFNDNIFIGLRYAYAWQNHQSDRFTIVDSYWGDYSGSVGKTSVNSHSIDAVGGIRCEMLKNFYMGWTFRCRFLLASKHSDDLKPYAIAGYGKYDNKVAIGFTYTLEYQIPFNKMHRK